MTGKGRWDAATSQGMLGAVGNSRKQEQASHSPPSLRGPADSSGFIAAKEDLSADLSYQVCSTITAALGA